MDLPGSPFTYTEADDAFSARVTRHASDDDTVPTHPYAYTTYSPRPDTPVPSSPPRLLRARASESGSIFHESVWPPPTAASQLTDPLTSHPVDLERIVHDVMGPGPSLRQPSQDDSAGGSSGSSRGGHGHARGGSTMSETVALLPPPPGALVADGVLNRTLTNPDPGTPISPFQTPEIPEPETPPRPPRWLSRSPNPSPKNSPIQIGRAL